MIDRFFCISIMLIMIIWFKNEAKDSITNLRKEMKQEIQEKQYSGREKIIYIMSRILFGKDEEEESK